MITGTCVTCRKPMPMGNFDTCIVCWKRENGYKLLRGDDQFSLMQDVVMDLLSQMRMLEIRVANIEQSSRGISPALRRRLLMLVHPDVHHEARKRLANEVTRELLETRP